ncbi:MAG: hypothetical protein IJ237_02830 [Oscillospiraceae bacterium]|nr:hypothetical protein [Oscillospiraceae bacterium]
MPREYVPVPIEYLAEMEPLSDENFGRLIRALLRYGSDGTPIDIDGDCRFYAVRVMNKDDHYALRAEEEEEKRERTSRRNSRNASARYRKDEPEAAAACDGMPLPAMAGNTIPNQSNPNQTSPYHTNWNSAEPEQSSAAALTIPLNDGSEYIVSEEDIAEWRKTYPAVDVEQELREMRSWCRANPKLRKTKRGVRRFMVAWLARHQDKGHPGMAVKQTPERRFVPTEL